MPKRAWLIVVLVACCLCVLGSVCVAAAYLGRGLLTSSDDLLSGGATRTLQAGSEQGARGADTLALSGTLPPTLDPAVVQDSTSAEYVVHLFSGLVTLDSRLEIVPDLAERWEVLDGGRTYLFHLLPNATFQDGTPITAEDFVYSLERACSPETRSPVALSYLGDIVGAPAFARGEADHIAGLTAPSADALRIEIDAPKAYFLAKLTYPTAFVVDRGQIEREGDGWVRKPNGSGPFALDSVSRDLLVLVHNERYYGLRPSLARVEFLLNSGLPMTLYENDQLDIVGVSPSEVERVLDPDNPLNAEYRVASELSVNYLAFNLSMPPFDDAAVRRAFVHAIDTKKIADLVLNNTALPARGIVPPGLPDYDAAVAEDLSYNPELARRLLASSRYAAQGAMPDLVLATSGTSGYMPAVERAILGMIEENLGLEIRVEQVEWADFLRDLNEQRYQMYTSGWIADYPDPQNFLDMLFHSDSPQNHTGYGSQPVDLLLEQARVEADPTKRMALYRQAEDVIVRDAPWIPLTHSVSYALAKPYVEGFQPGASLYPWLKDISLNK